MFYNVNTALQRGCPWLYHFKTRVSTTDYESHLSGYVCGSIFAFAYLLLVANTQPGAIDYVTVAMPFLTLIGSEVAAPALFNAATKDQENERGDKKKAK